MLFNVGNYVRIVKNGDGIQSTRHNFDIGSVGKVSAFYGDGIKVVVNNLNQILDNDQIVPLKQVRRYAKKGEYVRILTDGHYSKDLYTVGGIYKVESVHAPSLCVHLRSNNGKELLAWNKSEYLVLEDCVDCVDNVLSSNFLSIKMGLDRIIEVCYDDFNTVEILKEMKSRVKEIEKYKCK